MQRVPVLLLTWVGMIIYWLGLGRVVLRLRRGVRRVVVYHSCEAAESDFVAGLNSNTTPRVFASHLQFYQRYYNVVPVSALTGDRLPPYPLAITFDDGYQSTLGACRLLRDRGLPATVYLIAGTLQPGFIVWVNELNWYLHRHPATAVPLAARELGLPPDTQAASLVAAAVARYDRATVDRILRSLRVEIADPALECEARELYLSAGHLRMLAQEGVTFGNHTVTHPNLALSDADTVRTELKEAGLVLAPHAGAAQSFAFPFGAINPVVRSMAPGLGIESAMEIGGANDRFDPYAIARVPVSATTRAMLFAQIEVVDPLKAFARWLAAWAVRSPGTPRGRRNLQPNPPL